MENIIDKTTKNIEMKNCYWEVLYELPSSSIYILQNIYNMNSEINNVESDSKLSIESHDDYIDDKINTFSSYANIGDEKNNHVNSDFFKKYNKILIKTLLLGEVSISKEFVFLIDVLYILNIVAIDFKNHIFICINSNVIYIVFYFQKYYYSINITGNVNLKSCLKSFLLITIPQIIVPIKILYFPNYLF